MKRVARVIAMAFLFSAFSISVACAEVYFSGNLGAVFLSDADIDDGFDSGELTFDTGFGLLAAFGHSYGTGVRSEIELGYRANDIDRVRALGGSASVNGDVTSLSVMINGFYDFPVQGSFTPFIGAGLGFANVEADINGLGKEDDNVFAYQLAIGGSFDMSERMKFDIQYRYLGTSDPDFDGLEAEYNSHAIFGGLRYTF